MGIATYASLHSARLSLYAQVPGVDDSRMGEVFGGYFPAFKKKKKKTKDCQDCAGVNKGKKYFFM